MPFIEVKTNVNVSEANKEELVKELGKKINLIGKTESWLMINVTSNQSMYFQGSDEDCAIVEVKLYGEPDTRGINKFTESITVLINELLGVNKNRIYVNYFGTEFWGWNGSNF